MMSSFPLTNSIIFQDGYCTTNQIPSGKLTELWKITIFNGKTHYKWPFSIATLNYQRVVPSPAPCRNKERITISLLAVEKNPFLWLKKYLLPKPETYVDTLAPWKKDQVRVSEASDNHQIIITSRFY